MLMTSSNKTTNGHIHVRDMALGVVVLILISQRTVPVHWMVSLMEDCHKHQVWLNMFEVLVIIYAYQIKNCIIEHNEN